MGESKGFPLSNNLDQVLHMFPAFESEFFRYTMEEPRHGRLVDKS
jgi:hypothetical protein